MSFSNKILEIERLNDDIITLNLKSQEAMSDIESAKNSLESTISSIDQTINTFKYGGQLPHTKIEINEADQPLKRVLDKFEITWSPIKSNLGTVMFEPHKIDTTVQQEVIVPLNDSLNSTTSEIQSNTISIDNHEVMSARNYLKIHLKNLSPLITEMEDMVRQEEVAAGAYLTYLLYFFLLFNATCIILVIILIKRNLFNPLDELGHIFSDGDFDKKSDYNKDNEIGVIANSLNNLVDGLRQATSFVTKIGEGKLDVKFDGIDESKVIEGSLQGALINMREQMKRMDEQDEERKWTTEGLAKFVDILRASNNVKQLGDAIISNLVDYTKSNQGGIYILNEEYEDNPYLELISLYAFDTKKFEQKSYRPGEGLVGQTFLEKKTIFLLEVPEDYIEIKSGLGDSNPKNILLVPLKIENEIYGVIELASFHEYEVYQIEFVEKLGESIAATIEGVKNNNKTRLLLEDSQQLTEQMQAQEEEMRQNMEELTATQEEMARKETAVTAQLDAINNSLGTAEYDAHGSIITANNKFSESLGYTIETIMSADFHSLHGNPSIFEIIKKEQSWSGWIDKNHRSGASRNFKSSFNTLMDEEGTVIKIIELVTQFEKETEVIAQTDDWKELKEVEEELRQNLEELTITQEQLDKKLLASNQLLEKFNTLHQVITIDKNGVILEVNEKAKLSIGSNLSSVEELFEESLSLILKNEIKVLTLKNKNADKVDVTIFALNDGNENITIIW